MSEIEVDYVDHMGTDITVVNAARVSFNKQVEELTPKDEKLIAYLARNNHWTPFGHCMVTLRETVPIFVARQRFKHTVGFCYNEVSRRYVSEDPDFFSPEGWRKSAPNIKQGSLDELVEDSIMKGDLGFDYPQSLTGLVSDLEEESLDVYNRLINAGVAAEQARMVLPQSMMTSYYVTGSLAAWARAYKLRAEASAQKEIRYLASLWFDRIEHLFPVSWKELTNNTNTEKEE